MKQRAWFETGNIQGITYLGPKEFELTEDIPRHQVKKE